MKIAFLPCCLIGIVHTILPQCSGHNFNSFIWKAVKERCVPFSPWAWVKYRKPTCCRGLLLRLLSWSAEQLVELVGQESDRLVFRDLNTVFEFVWGFSFGRRVVGGWRCLYHSLRITRSLVCWNYKKANKILELTVRLGEHFSWKLKQAVEQCGLSQKFATLIEGTTNLLCKYIIPKTQ